MAGTSDQTSSKSFRAALRLIRKRSLTTRRRHRGPGAKEKRLGQAIRRARRLVNLTQAQLGTRLGIRAQSVYRWENDRAAPTPRHEREIVRVIATYSADAAGALQAAIDKTHAKTAPSALTQAPTSPTPVSPQQTTPVAVGPSDALQLAVFGLADDLDLPVRRVRRPLARFFDALRAVNLTFDAAGQQLNGWIVEQRY
ncbi:MAG TPA: helix-turn-helix transcriptional regulator [Polyangiaceae bacterium]